MSRKEIYVCDCCGKEIPVIKKRDILGIEREYLQSGHLEALHSVGKIYQCLELIFVRIVPTKLIWKLWNGK